MVDQGTTKVTVRVGFDIGGTFTDVIIAASTGQLFVFKVLSTAQEVAGREYRV